VCLLRDFVFFVSVCFVVGDDSHLPMRTLRNLGVGVGSSTLILIFLKTFHFCVNFFNFSLSCIIFPIFGL